MDQEEKQRNYDLAERLLSEQRFSAAIIVGAITALFAAATCSIIIGQVNHSSGFADAAIGIVVGLSMRYAGRGIESKFAVAASLYTIAACILGDMLRIDTFRAHGSVDSLFDYIWETEFSLRIGGSISFIDLFFWLVAVWCAVFLAIRSLSRAERLAIGLYQLKS